MKNIAELKSEFIKDFKSDPRNKIHVGMDLLTLSVLEETGKTITAKQLTKIIGDWQNGDLDDNGTAVYDGAVVVCGELANECLGGDPDADVDYEITWLEDERGLYAEIRIN